MKKTYACPKCNRALLKKYHQRKDKTFRCPYCLNITATPNVREKIDKRIGKKRIIPDSYIMTRNKLLSFLNKRNLDPYKQTKKDIMNDALICFLYLTASRISEVIGIRDPDKKGQFLVEPIRKDQIETLMKFDNKIWRIENIPILKRKLKKGVDLEGNEVTNYPLRNVSVLYDIEEPFIEYINKWLKLLPQDDSIVFNICRQHAWRICIKVNKSFNHYWRHCRLTNLATEYNLTDLQLMHFVGWGSSQMAAKYTHLDDTALVKAMIMNMRN